MLETSTKIIFRLLPQSLRSCRLMVMEPPPSLTQLLSVTQLPMGMLPTDTPPTDTQPTTHLLLPPTRHITLRSPRSPLHTTVKHLTTPTHQNLNIRRNPKNHLHILIFCDFKQWDKICNKNKTFTKIQESWALSFELDHFEAQRELVQGHKHS